MSTALETESEFAVVLLQQDGTIVDAHPTCYDSLGWNREDLAGKDIGELLQSDRDLLMSQLLQSRDQEMGIDGQTSFSIRILARRRDETSFPARVVVRRFDQTECCTVAFYRVTPHYESDATPIVRPEEIELAMRGNTEHPGAPAPASAKPEKPKSRWRNARLLFGSKSQQEPPTPAPQAPPPALPRAIAPPSPVPPPPPVQPARQAPKFDAQVPENIFIRKDVPAPEPEPVAPAVTEPEPVQESAEPVASEPAPVVLTPARPPLVEDVVEATDSQDGDKPAYEALASELEQEREERRRLEQRAASLTSQVSALHLQVSENLDIESRNQKKVTTLEEQLRESRNQLTQVKSDLASERQRSIAAEEKVEAANAVSARLTEQLEALKLVHDALTRTQSESESQLQAVNSELKQAQETLAAESMKRHELELALSAAQQEHSEKERNSKLELSKLETGLKTKEFELKELETRQAQAALQAKG